MAFNPNDYLISLKGKKYLQVAHRLMWFREEHPQGTVATDVVSIDPLICKATILDVDNRILGTGHGSATVKPNAVWSGREVEKAETAAIGRALAAAGFGTQFAEDYEDDDHLSDSPVAPPKKAATARNSNGTDQPRTSTGKTAETAIKDGTTWRVSLTHVTSEEGKTGQTRYRFTSAENVQGIYAYSRDVFVSGNWCTGDDWKKHGTYELPALCPATILYHAFADGGGYWTVEQVDEFMLEQPALMNHDATPAATPSHIEDPLRGELLEITHVEPRMRRSGSHTKQWIGHARFDGQPIEVTLFAEDRRQITDAGYDTSEWENSKGQRYGGGDIVVTTGRDTVARKLTGVWHKEQDKLVAVERAR